MPAPTNPRAFCAAPPAAGAHDATNIAHRSSERGQALVEFALVLPIVVVIFLGVVLFGVALNTWIDETQLTSTAARFAAVNFAPTEEIAEGKVTEGSAVMTEVSSYTGIAVGMEVVGKGLPKGTTITSKTSTEEAKKELGLSAKATATEPKQKYRFIGTNEELKDETTQAAFLTWLKNRGDSGEVQGAEAKMCSPTSKTGDYVEVKLTSNYTWFGLAGMFGAKAETPLTSTARMRIEKPPINPYPTSC